MENQYTTTEGRTLWYAPKNGYTFVYPLATLTTMANKDAGLRIRVARDLRDEFVEVCRAEDKTAAQVLREFMRKYIEKYRGSQQRNLFDQQQ